MAIDEGGNNGANDEGGDEEDDGPSEASFAAAAFLHVSVSEAMHCARWAVSGYETQAMVMGGEGKRRESERKV